eukprot:686383-Pyramimonas_sp.AAC.1
MGVCSSPPTVGFLSETLSSPRSYPGKMNCQISFKKLQNHPKVTNWAPAVNRQPFLPPGDS